MGGVGLWFLRPVSLLLSAALLGVLPFGTLCCQLPHHTAEKQQLLCSLSATTDAHHASWCALLSWPFLVLSCWDCLLFLLFFSFNYWYWYWYWYIISLLLLTPDRLGCKITLLKTLSTDPRSNFLFHYSNFDNAFDAKISCGKVPNNGDFIFSRKSKFVGIWCRGLGCILLLNRAL